MHGIIGSLKGYEEQSYEFGKWAMQYVLYN